jgi:hypothetical protein
VLDAVRQAQRLDRRAPPPRARGVEQEGDEARGLLVDHGGGAPAAGSGLRGALLLLLGALGGPRRTRLLLLLLVPARDLALATATAAAAAAARDRFRRWRRRARAVAAARERAGVYYRARGLAHGDGARAGLARSGDTRRSFRRVIRPLLVSPYGLGARTNRPLRSSGERYHVIDLEV